MSEAAPAAPRDATFRSQRLVLHYVEWGPPDAPPLVLVHGGRDHCRSWDAVAAAFAGERRVIAPDLRGHGDSAWAGDGGYAMIDFVFDLAELLRILDVPQVDLVAHSLGGNIALRFAGIYPDKIRRLAVIEGLGPSPAMIAKEAATPVAERLREWIDTHRRMLARTARRYASFEEALARMVAVNPGLPAATSRHLATHAVRPNDDGSVSFRYDPALLGMSPADLGWREKHELWGAITCPVLLLYGSASWASNPAADGRAVHFRDVRVEVCEGAGHWLHHDRPDWFLSQLRSFL